MHITLPGRTIFGGAGQTTGRTTLGSSKRRSSTSTPGAPCIQSGCTLMVWILQSSEHSSTLLSFVMKTAGSVSLVLPEPGEALIPKISTGTWAQKMIPSFLFTWTLCEWYLQRKCPVHLMSCHTVPGSWWCISPSTSHTSSLSQGWGYFFFLINQCGFQHEKAKLVFLFNFFIILPTCDVSPFIIYIHFMTLKISTWRFPTPTPNRLNTLFQHWLLL